MTNELFSKKALMKMSDRINATITNENETIPLLVETSGNSNSTVEYILTSTVQRGPFELEEEYVNGVLKTSTWTRN